VGLVVDGQMDLGSGVAQRWLAPVDLESGVVADPEPLAPIALSDRAVTLCTGDDYGWVLDAPFPGQVFVHLPARAPASLGSVVARLRVGRGLACIERLMGSLDGVGGDLFSSPVRSAAAAGPLSPSRHATGARDIEVAVGSGRVRYPLRCARH
jgi:hypothetical protein